MVTKSRRLSLDRACGTRVRHETILVGNLDGKRPLEKPRGRWEDNIKMDLKMNMMLWAGLMYLRIEQ
jgi:hypothetical protein